MLVIGGYFDASKMGSNERNGSICQAAKEKVCSARSISLWEYCEVLEVGIGRLILSQQEEKLASGGVCGVLVEFLADPFSFVGVVVDILFFVGGALGWSVPTAVASVVGGDDNGRLWKKDGMVCVEGVVAPFCFPFLEQDRDD